MKQRFVLALLIVIAGFTSCKDDNEVVQAPVISGIENAYTILQNANLELNPIIENDNNANYIWQLDGKEVAKTLTYLFVESTPGEYKLVLKVMNEGGVDEVTIAIVVGSKDFTVEAVTHKVISLVVPDYMKNNGELKWEVLDAPSELYRFSQMTPEAPLFIAANEGVYKLQVTAGDIKGEMKIVVTKATTEPSPYIAKVLDYLPAPGQFVNKIPKYVEGDTHEDMVAKAATNLVGKDARFITLGGWGGYVTFGFDHTIVNVADKKDFRIEGNAFPNSCEPGIIMVSYDANVNGKADDEWYEINGSGNLTAENEEWYQLAVDNGNDVNTYRDFEMTYYRPEVETTVVLKDYIRWTNNKGKEGYKEKNAFHRQSYYPLWIKEDKIIFKGIRLAESGIDESGQGSYFVLKGFKFGYVDNHPNNNDGSTFDIDSAVDKDGKKVNLPGIDFVKVYTGVDQENGWLGESSTEIGKSSDLHLLGVSIDSVQK
ncbi:MAG: PKD-like domain-containing protein [Candidatus Saccharimonadaceae bacterium]